MYAIIACVELAQLWRTEIWIYSPVASPAEGTSIETGQVPVDAARATPVGSPAALPHAARSGNASSAPARQVKEVDRFVRLVSRRVMKVSWALARLAMRLPGSKARSTVKPLHFQHDGANCPRGGTSLGHAAAT
jgi:hypothetical protein